MGEVEDEIVLEKIADELLQLTDKYNIEKNYDTLIRFAAAYGTIFERLGAEWAWNPEIGVVCLEKEGKKFPVPSIYPFNIIFHWINYGDVKRESIEYLLRIDLKSFKVYCDK